MPGPVIDTSAGRVSGFVRDDVLHVRGLPYGTAKRFQAPEPHPGWTGTMETTRPGPACPQLPSRLDGVTGPIVDGLVQSEDCLVVSVWAPADAAQLPVLVWFHGGAYLSGGGESPRYTGERLAAEGLVVVSVTYRLGVLGYLPPCGLGEPNAGLRDQLLALRWVRENAAAFGGDVNRVTLVGQSAGADAVLSMLTVDDVAQWVRGAVLQSPALPLRDGREPMTAALAALADDAQPRGTTAELSELLTMQTTLAQSARAFGVLGSLPMAPCAGYDPLPTPAEAAAKLHRAARSVDLLVGCTADDAAPFVALDPRAERLRRVPGTGFLRRRIEARVTKRLFAAPVLELAQTWRREGGSAVRYRFDWAPGNTALGSCHCIELPFLFGSEQAWADAPMLGGRAPHPELSARMTSTWAAFAAGGAAALAAQEITFA
jgi:para-nitrobenzyl esterase